VVCRSKLVIRSVVCRSKLVISELLVNPNKRSRFHLNPKGRVSLFMHRLQAESEDSHIHWSAKPVFKFPTEQSVLPFSRIDGPSLRLGCIDPASRHR
jgi:hypothetical protein